MQTNQRTHNQSGFAALLIIAVIGAVALMLGLTAAMSGVIELEVSYTAQKGEEALHLTDGCIEETLRRVKLDSDYGIGDGTIDLILTNGDCEVSVSDLGSNQRKITTNGNVDQYFRTIQIELTTTNDTITIDTWQEN